MMGDDSQTGHLLTRRELLALLGASGVGLFLGSRASTATARSPGNSSGCVVRPEQTEGPYFVDEVLDRSDIRSDPASGVIKAGVPLVLAFHVTRLTGDGCTPLEGAQVDVWHCDAQGIYSGVTDPDFDTTNQKFLRGYQRTDAKGVARFTTIYPGWYPGRTVHIHFKIRTHPTASRSHEFTSQVYFDDAVTDRVLQRAPYASDRRGRNRNQEDGIFRHGGRQLLAALAESGQGYAGNFDVALDLD